MFICADTEDDSVERMIANRKAYVLGHTDRINPGFDKQITQIAARTYGGYRFHNRGNVKEFLKWLEKQPEKYVYFHNVQYDLGNLFGEELDCLDVNLVGGRIIRAVWRNKTFLDTFNIWPMRAAMLAKAFGLEKLEMDVHSKEYVFRDVDIIFAAMEFAWKLAAEMGLSKCPATLGGFAVKVWKEFGGENCHDTNPLSKEAYYGGRVELFKQHNDTDEIAYTDINSLYPSAMLLEYPAEMQDWTATQLPKFGIIKCKVKVPKTLLPVLPYRDKEGRILFPWGKFTGTWTIAEITEAIKRGATILETYECRGTNEAMRPYDKYVTKLYEMRLRSDSAAEKLFFKLLLNNLYGRLGTGGIVGKSVWQDDDNRDEGVCYGGKVLVNYHMPLSAETNWSHAAYVAAYGRIALLEFIEKVGVERMIYCDTDSCIFDCPGKQLPFEVGNKLGQMKLESWETECETYAPKAYRYGDKWKAKGVPVKLAKQFLTQGRVDFDLPFKMREAIRFYDKANSKRLSVWRNVEKFRRSEYDKKRQKKNSFIPLQIAEG